MLVDFYVYILKCADNSYYTGHTDDIEKRLSEHVEGGYEGYTASRCPLKLVFLCAFLTRYEVLVVDTRDERIELVRM